MQNVRETASNVLEKAREKTGQAYEAVKDKASDLFGKATRDPEKEKEHAKSREERMATAATYNGPVSIFSGAQRPANRAVVFAGDGKVQIKDIGYPKMKLPWSDEPVVNGCIIKVLTSGICGTDLHSFRGRTAAQSGTVFGHEFTGEVVELGAGCQETRLGDWGFVQGVISCGCCASCKAHNPHVCEKTNVMRDAVGFTGVFGMPGGGEWNGGQAEYVFVPWADFNFVKFPNKERARERLLDLTMCTDVFPTAFHGAEGAHVGVGSTVYIAGAGPIGLAAVLCCNLKGAACVIVGDFNTERLVMAQKMGAYTIDLNNMKTDKSILSEIKNVVGRPSVDCAIDCVGYEARLNASDKNDITAALDTCIEVLKPGGHLGCLGVYMGGDPNAPTLKEKAGNFSFSWGKLWAKAITVSTGSVCIPRYADRLMNAILFDKAPIAKLLGTKVISFDEVPEAYEKFAKGFPHKFVIDPHNTLGLQQPRRRSADMETETAQTQARGQQSALPVQGQQKAKIKADAKAK